MKIICKPLLIADEFTQEDWDDVTENYENIPEIVSNAFIIRKIFLKNTNTV